MRNLKTVIKESLERSKLNERYDDDESEYWDLFVSDELGHLKIDYDKHVNKWTSHKPTFGNADGKKLIKIIEKYLPLVNKTMDDFRDEVVKYMFISLSDMTEICENALDGAYYLYSNESIKKDIIDEVAYIFKCCIIEDGFFDGLDSKNLNNLKKDINDKLLTKIAENIFDDYNSGNDFDWEEYLQNQKDGDDYEDYLNDMRNSFL